MSAAQSAPGLIRFRVAGYDLLASFTSLYISTPEDNGTFLLTADRAYTADYRPRTETVYMLFAADVPAPGSASSQSSGSAGSQTSGAASYTVTVSVLQDMLNQNSFLYRLLQAAPLHAEKTGNLVSIRLDDDLKADILLQIQ